MYIREDSLKHAQTIAMIIQLNHGIVWFNNDEIKEILSYIPTMWILILSIVFYNSKTATDQVDVCVCVCVCVCVYVCVCE